MSALNRQIRRILAETGVPGSRTAAALERLVREREHTARAEAADALLAELSAPSNGLVHRCGGQEYIDTATLTAVAQSIMRRGGADAG